LLLGGFFLLTQAGLLRAIFVFGLILAAFVADDAVFLVLFFVSNGHENQRRDDHLVPIFEDFEVPNIFCHLQYIQIVLLYPAMSYRRRVIGDTATGLP